MFGGFRYVKRAMDGDKNKHKPRLHPTEKPKSITFLALTDVVSVGSTKRMKMQIR